MNTAAVNSHRGVAVYEISGVALEFQRYDAHLSPQARQDAQRVIAFAAVLDSVACRLRWFGEPVRVSA